jgi:predicted amidohydrolase YtcJ
VAGNGDGERIFSNARVYTAHGRRPWAEAVGVTDGVVRAVGALDEVRRDMRPGVEEIDLGGRLVIPGLIDAHNHFLSTGEALAGVDARYPVVASIADLVAAVAAAASETPPGRWVRGFGMDYAKYPEKRVPTRWDLDGATAEHPVVVKHVSGHYALVNSAVLAARGITEDVRDPKGGRFVRDSEGRLTGLCLDAAVGVVIPVAVDIGCHGPNIHFDAPLDELVSDLGRADRAYLAAGLTTVCDPQVTRRELVVYREARRRGLVHVRTVCMLLSSQLDEAVALGLAGPFGDDRLAIAAMKFYADGSLIGGTAAFSEPYGERGEFTGLTYWEPEELAELVARAHAAGWQVGIHTQGDRAVEMSLDAIEGALRGSPRDDARHRIEHAGFPTAKQLDRMASLGIVTVNQPLYLFDSGDDFLVRLGSRAHGLQPLRSEVDRGVSIVLSSDSFVASYKPLETIAAAVMRRTRRGEPIGADEALTVEESVRAYTVEAARALGMEAAIGSLEPGKLADLVVLGDDVFAVSPERIQDVPIEMTVVGGEPAFTRG